MNEFESGNKMGMIGVLACGAMVLLLMAQGGVKRLFSRA